MTPPVALSVAGSDPSGGAGIQADLKTFAAHGVYGTSVVTAVTSQNSYGVAGVFAVPAEVVASQLSAVVDDLRPGAVKVGMVPAVGDAAEMAARIGALPNLVLDPVLVSSSGFPLGALSTVEHLLPYATVVTPNAAEAALLTGRPVGTPAEMAAAAERIAAAGPRCVVVTGGDRSGDEALDAVWTVEGVRFLRARRVATPNTHGTGCTFSAAIAARLARGEPVPAAVAGAKEYVTRALAGAAGWRLGNGGHGPLDHLGFGPPARPPAGPGREAT
jgi:hydroxymethylpyrimidine kinase/phosphomethylpyrimidine kinase